jgi:hypothetical protein
LADVAYFLNVTGKLSRASELAIEIVFALLIVGAIVAYAMSSVRIPFSRNWGALAGETLILFWNVVAFVRRYCQKTSKWWIVSGAFVAHIAIGAAACTWIEAIPLICFALAGIAEIVLIVSILQRLELRPTPVRSK